MMYMYTNFWNSYFLEFLEYFKNNYLHKYNTNNWNYYKNIEHITNNASESFNNYLNNLFSKKPSFFKLIYILKKEESLSYNDYERRINGIWRKKQKIIRKTDEIKNIIENYKYMEKDYIYNGYDRKDIVELWYNCLIDLNNKKY
ncbi:hypothetical protein BCR32DRAFT_284513 [Anaeromyces robustus]|uniref:Uncharacterized protein n=1 Tax=Anaeromyces robustus TaxID=1754192 RepID=A0A1Y1WRV2_9FUNG|nr:hypothetical protein BCR32DRAFT_284513 [Anaeromyces robustus]|eukprot:ORX76115.1 hypothetical protein BCR32DRAFT_284513 [Anaeromyces robustus]